MRYLLCAAAVAAALSLPSARAADILNTGGFEGYAPGAIAGQHGWVNNQTFGQPLKDAVIAAAPGGGQAICFDDTQPAGTPGTESSIQIPFPNLTGTDQFVTTSFDFFREGNGLYNNLWWWPVGSNPWGGLQWDNAANATPGAQILPFGFAPAGQTYPPGVLMPQNQWVHMVLQFDLVNGTESAWVNGVPAGTDVNIGKGEFAGWFFSDTNTVDPARSPNGVGQRAYVDNLVITAGRFTPVPEPATLSLLALGVLPFLRRRK